MWCRKHCMQGAITTGPNPPTSKSSTWVSSPWWNSNHQVVCLSFFLLTVDYTNPDPDGRSNVTSSYATALMRQSLKLQTGVCVWSVYFNHTVNRAPSDNQAIMNCKWSSAIDRSLTARGLPMSMLHQAAPFCARQPLTVSLSRLLLSQTHSVRRQGPSLTKKPIIWQAALIVWLNRSLTEQHRGGEGLDVAGRPGRSTTALIRSSWGELADSKGNALSFGDGRIEL